MRFDHVFDKKKSIADVFAGGVTSLPGHLRVCGVNVGGFRCNSDCNEKNTITKQLIIHSKARDQLSTFSSNF